MAMNIQKIVVHFCLFRVQNSLSQGDTDLSTLLYPFMGTIWFYYMKVHFCHARCIIVLQLVKFDEVQKYKIVSQKGTPGATLVCTLLSTFPYFYFLLCTTGC